MSERNKDKKHSIFDRMMHGYHQSITLRYKSFAIFATLTLLFILVVGMLYKPALSAKEYALNTSLNLGSYSLRVEQKYLNRDQKRMLLMAYLTGNNRGVQSEVKLNIQTKIKGDSSKNTMTSVFKGDSNYYEIEVDNLPDKWASMMLVLTDQSTNQSVDLILHRHPNNQEFMLLPDDVKVGEGYASTRSIQNEIAKQSDILNKEIPEKMTELDEDIRAAEVQIEGLKNKMKYETAKEKEQTETDIAVLESRKAKAESDRLVQEKRKEEVTEKLALLSEKLKEYTQKNNMNPDEAVIQ